MAARRMMLPDYGTVSMKGTQYYRTRVTDQQGRRVSLYARTREELYQKEQEAIQQIENKTYRRSTPTVEEYCEKWLLMQSAQIRMTTLIDYTSKVKNYIIKPLGDMHMGDVTADDIRLALLAASKKSASVYKSVNVLYKCIFTAAMESKIIDENPTIYLKKNVGGIPQKDRLPLTDEQVDKLLDAIYGLPPYVFVMLGLYAGLRREEILGLQWDSVYLDCEAPYLTVRRAWHTEHNRPVILTELKTKAAHRNVPLPDNLLECLKEAKKTSTSDFVVANRDGDPLSYTQFKRLWQYIVTRTTKERCYKEWTAQGIEILEEEKRLPIIILEPGKAYRRDDGSIGQNFYAKEVYDISQTSAQGQYQPQVTYDDRLLLKGLIASSPMQIRAVDELPQGRGAVFSEEQNAILVKKGMDAPDIFRCVSLEIANVQLARNNEGYSREADGYKAYAVSYMLCKRYGIEAKGYDIGRLNSVFKGQDPREDVPAALSDMRETFKSLNGRMARAMGLTRNTKQKEPER